MDKRKEANLRVKSHIVHALMDLMKEKSYEEISISWKSPSVPVYPGYPITGITAARKIF